MIVLKTYTIRVENQIGLHARPAALLVEKANNFASNILIEYANRRVNAKSLIGVLSLQILGGSEIRIITDGIDEKEAMDSIVELIKNNYDEKTY